MINKRERERERERERLNCIGFGIEREVEREKSLILECEDFAWTQGGWAVHCYDSSGSIQCHAR